uniref:Uncharacterized protein n=1 Tax=viral metagenome TaxID=1070528 RepID=A0A6C0AE71_9ZZZZ
MTFYNFSGEYSVSADFIANANLVFTVDINNLVTTLSQINFLILSKCLY